MLSIPHGELLKSVARRIVDRHSAPADQAVAESAIEYGMKVTGVPVVNSIVLAVD
jgi:hypothetical protein